MKFYYRAVTQYGKQIEGLIEARDVKEAAHYLKRHQLIPIKVTSPEKIGFGRFFSIFQKSSTKDLIFFTRQISSMLTSGLTLMQALVILRDQSRNTSIGPTVETIVTDVEGGKTFSGAIEKYPQIFSSIYIALIRTGESSGLLDKVMIRLADNLEKQQRLQQTIRSALLYPLIVVLMMIIVTIIMLVFVIPQLSGLYQNLNIELPLQTRIVLTLSDIVRTAWPLLLIGIVAVTYLTRRWYKDNTGRHIIDGYLLKLPIFGKLLGESMLAEFCRTFGLLISSGSLVVESLLKSSKVVNNIHYQEAINLVARRVEKGISVSDALGSSIYFPPYLTQMVKIGEQTGKLDDSLLKASEYYEREVEQTVKTLTTLMEPLIMVLLALGVGFLIFAIITPIWNLLSTIQ